MDDDADGQMRPPDAEVIVDAGEGDAGAVDADVEADRGPRTACADGLDNDRDGRVDFPDDPGCVDAADDDEADPIPLPQCSDGLDNDADGELDLADPDCTGPTDPTEGGLNPTTVCHNQQDDDGDGLVDFPFDPGCFAAGHNSEADPSPRPACANGEDDDGNGVADFPADPGCAGAGDEEEAPVEPAPACANGLDDDEDGLIDFPEDFGCVAAGDPSEGLACEATPDVIEVVIEPGVAQRIAYDTRGRENLFEASCGSNARSPDQPFAMVVPVAVTGTITVENFAGDSVLHIRRVCDDPASQVACNDDAVGLLSRLSFERLEAGIYYVIADGYSNGNQAAGELVFDLAAAPAACSDGRDNDADGLIDLNDPGCEDAEDDDEENPALPACSNRLDDDQDMLIDLDDPGCADADDDDEFNEPLPACSNRLDDDGDGRIDAADPGCEGPDDNDEVNPPLCDDGVDNDDDGLVDLADTGCTGPTDDDEADPPEVPACADGIDNDEDGFIDWPDDQDCPAAGGPSELLLCMATPDVIVVHPLDADPIQVPFDTTGREPLFTGSCGGGAAPDQVVAVIIDAPSRMTAEITQANHDTVLHVRTSCDDAMTQLACDDDGGQGLLAGRRVAPRPGDRLRDRTGSPTARALARDHHRRASPSPDRSLTCAAALGMIRRCAASSSLPCCCRSRAARRARPLIPRQSRHRSRVVARHMGGGRGPPAGARPGGRPVPDALAAASSLVHELAPAYAYEIGPDAFGARPARGSVSCRRASVASARTRWRWTPGS
ncbi:MAG: hypothetical protein R3F43_18610 [bacterium]